MALVRRSKAPPTFLRQRKLIGFTDAQGFQTADAPANWPFGMKSRERMLSEAMREVLGKNSPAPNSDR